MSEYGRLKAVCERLVADTAARRGLSGVSLRIPHVFGPDDSFAGQARWVDFAELVTRLESGADCVVSAELVRQRDRPGINWIDVRDLARLVAAPATRTVSGAFDVAGGRIDWADIVAELAIVLGSTSAVEFASDNAAVIELYDEDPLDLTAATMFGVPLATDWRTTFRDMFDSGPTIPREIHHR
jgi:nucleoside-diphosphate-sugar epimerase